jgi:pilus assembly protein CpaB
VSQRRGIILVIAGLGIAVVGIFVVTNLVRNAATPPPAPTPVPPITAQVVVITHDIAIRELLKEEDLEVIEVPVELAPFDAISDVDDVVGRITKIPFVTGEIVFEHHLVDPTNVNQDYAFVLEDDQVLLAFPATDLMSEVNVLQPGDIVDILVSVEQPVLPGESIVTNLGEEEKATENAWFTFNALQRIEITAIVVDIIPQRSSSSSSGSASSVTSAQAEATPQPTPTPEPAEINAQAILLALDPQDALILKHINDTGGLIDIVLRAPTSNQIFELSPVTSDYLRDRYELVIER